MGLIGDRYPNREPCPLMLPKWGEGGVAYKKAIARGLSHDEAAGIAKAVMYGDQQEHYARTARGEKCPHCGH